MYKTTYPIADKIRKIASEVQEKEAFDIKSFISKIPGLKLPTYEQAIDIIQKFLAEKGPAAENVIDKITNTVAQSMNSRVASMDVTAGFMDSLRALKFFAKPSVILATIALMGALNTADAGKLKDFLKTQKGNVQQEQKVNNSFSVTQQQGVVPSMITLEGENNISPQITKQLQSELNAGKLMGVITDSDGTKYGFGVDIGGTDLGGSFQLTKNIADQRAMSSVPNSVVKRIVNRTDDGRIYCISITKE